MNLNRILILSLLVLVISTYQTDSGIIFSLLLKVLLLKGALFMSMPLTIGAFMMGQGMGFFAGNMMGGYMMLRAANRYHNQEKTKWASFAEVAPHYMHPGSGGWGQQSSGFKYQEAYDKGKDIGSALAALKSHKFKLKSALHHVKGIFVGHHDPTPPHPGWGYNSNYKPAPTYYSKAPVYQKSKGWGWGSPSSYGSFGSPSKGYDYQYASNSKQNPVTARYKLYPNDIYKQMAAAAKAKGNVYGGSPAVAELYKSAEGEILKGQMNYQHYYPPGSVGGDSHGAKTQDPSNTYYTSAYGGPGHEYTGMLTHNQPDSYLQDTAQDKSSEESGFFREKDSLGSLSSPSEPTSTVSPNPLLEKYLEKRLEEEADKQKDVEQKQEAQQLIQMLRKAYLKQLVTSLKEEEKLGSGSAESVEFTRGSRSIEDADKNSIIRDLLFSKIPIATSSETKAERSSTEIMNELIAQTPPAPITSSETYIKSSTERFMASTENLVNDKPSTEKLTTTTEQLTSTERIERPVSTSEDYISSTANYVSSTENYPSSTESPISSTESPISSTESPIIPSTEEAPRGSAEPPVQETTTAEATMGFPDFGMPAMWVKADNTFSEESAPFMIRVKRDTADQGEEEEQEESQVHDEGQAGQQPGGAMPEETAKQIHAFVDDIKKFFTLLTVLDQDQCLQKLVCDVHTNQKDLSTITQYEQNILTTFKLMKALMPPGEEDSSTKYRRAALIGETGQSLELCQHTFSPCGFSSSQIITLGTQTEATPTDWAGAGTAQEPQRAARRREFVTVEPNSRRTLGSYYL